MSYLLSHFSLDKKDLNKYFDNKSWVVINSNTKAYCGDKGVKEDLALFLTEDQL